MNLPASFSEFVRNRVEAFAAQAAEYADCARECLSAARGSYGIAQRVHLRSARHYGKMARMCRAAATAA